MEKRYQRHEMIPGWKQHKLAKAKVIIVGVGAIGNEVLRLLALAGVYEFIICDHDVVSVSNLSRCSLFKEDDVGLSKVEAAKNNIAYFLPNLKIDSRPKSFLKAIGLGDIKSADLIISCVDSIEDRIDIAARCNLVESPYIDCGTQPWGGEVRLFFNVREACYACEHIYKDLKNKNKNWSCINQEVALSSGASILMTTLVSSITATFAVRYLMGFVKYSFFLRIDGATGQTQKTYLKRSLECLLHSPINGKTIHLPISIEDSIEKLLTHISTDEEPMLWEEIIDNQCFNCDAIIPSAENIQCPNCNEQFIPIYKKSLRQFDNHILLKELNIPECEILAVRNNVGTNKYIELTKSTK